MFLLGKDGPLLGSEINLSKGVEWVVGREKEKCFFALEDPTVSRVHVKIILSDNKYTAKNLSNTNPVEINGQIVHDESPLSEGDTIQIGNTLFEFLSRDATPVEKAEQNLPFVDFQKTKWIIKVVEGPNQGAEFGLSNEEYLLGKDINNVDLAFQDLSISGKHCKLTVSDKQITIEDLKSTNGLFLNGTKIEKSTLESEDLISMGTTVWSIVDIESSRTTIHSAAILPMPKKKKSFLNDLFVPTRHLVFIPILIVVIMTSFMGVISLFRGKSATKAFTIKDKDITNILSEFKHVKGMYNGNHIFLSGHVETDLEHNMIIYKLKSLPYVKDIKDNIVIDKKVSEEMNALMLKNHDWHNISFGSQKPGTFVIQGYLKTEAEEKMLKEFVIQYFPYPDLLVNKVVVENLLEMEINKILLQNDLVNVLFQLNSGEVILEGTVGAHKQKDIDKAIKQLGACNGIKSVRNFVVTNTTSTESKNLSSKYRVTGSSVCGNSTYVVVNGKILAKGDMLDQMTIISVNNNNILLIKDGIKYRIDYYLQ